MMGDTGDPLRDVPAARPTVGRTGRDGPHPGRDPSYDSVPGVVLAGSRLVRLLVGLEPEPVIAGLLGVATGPGAPGLELQDRVEPLVGRLPVLVPPGLEPLLPQPTPDPLSDPGELGALVVPPVRVREPLRPEVPVPLGPSGPAVGDRP